MAFCSFGANIPIVSCAIYAFKAIGFWQDYYGLFSYAIRACFTGIYIVSNAR